MKRFKSPGQAQRFLSAHDQIGNLFHLRRDHRPASQYRAARTQAFQTWAEVTLGAHKAPCGILYSPERPGPPRRPPLPPPC
jgi:putative transposase